MTAKHVRDMSDKEYKDARRNVARGTEMNGETAVKTTGPAWDVVASHIRSMKTAELTAFETAYGISITINPPE
jgi:hypothetical protein